MLGYISGEYDILRAKDLRKIDEAVQINREKGNKYFAVAIYDTELCSQLGMDAPLKSTADRAKIMEQIEGIDFTFVVDSIDENEIVKKATEAYNKFLKRKNEKDAEKTKKYKTVYVPGTYDLFHAGHLENLLEASKLGEKLIAGVKSDEVVKKQKGDYPKISAEERMEILRHFKFIDDVYEFYTRDLHVAADWVEGKYGTRPAIVCGNDLKKDYKNVTGLDIIYTDRDEKKMKERSTSTYKKKLKLGQIEIPNEDKYSFTGSMDLMLPSYIDDRYEIVGEYTVPNDKTPIEVTDGEKVEIQSNNENKEGFLI